MMQENKYTWLTLDIWDTILRRKCHPDEIKVQTARYLWLKYFSLLKEKKNIYELTKDRINAEISLGKQCRESSFDDEYNIKDVFELWCKLVLNIKDLDCKTIVEDLYNFELETEKRNVYLDPFIVETISNINYKYIACISDFYADHKFINEILEYVKFPYKFDKQYISCEVGYNKRSGRLFDYVSDELKVNHRQWLHIGDNKNSDYNIPLSKGIQAKYYLPIQEDQKRKEVVDSFSLNQGYKGSLYTSSVQLSIFFYSFISWITEECIKKDIRKIFFFTREGEFFQEIYNEIKKYNPYGCILPNAEILEVSRLSTFFPSLREITLQELMRLWNQYSVQSMNSFFKSLGIENSYIKDELFKYEISFEEEIVYPWLDKRIIQLFEDNEFINKMEKIHNERKLLLKQYCYKKGLLDSDKHVAIVDIGWRGTIQDNLCYLFPNTILEGFYVGVLPFLNEQPQNSNKLGFINDCSCYKFILSTVTPFEMVCNSPNGSTISYRKENDDIQAIRVSDAKEDMIYLDYTKNFQNDIISQMKSYCEFSALHNIMSMDYYNLACQEIYNFITKPDYKLAKTYFNLKHNEEFGVGKYVDKKTYFNFKVFMGAPFSHQARIRLKDFLLSTTWPQGYLTKYHLKILLPMYNRLAKKHFRE